MKRLLALALALLAALLPAAGCSALAEADAGDFVFFAGAPDEGAEAGTAGGYVPPLAVGMSESGGVVRGGPQYNGAVFQEDDRETIYATELYPYVAVAYMDIHYACGCEATGTGFMVERNKLMTAAHCIVCTDHRKQADWITFYFGYYNDRVYAYKYTGGWYAFWGNSFPNGYTTDDDWAVVKFYENVGDTVGWFGFEYGMPDSKITGKKLYLLGYRSGILRISSGYASKGYGDLLKYQIDMEPGNSGGPVFYLDGETPYAVAINIAENDRTNFGHRLTNEIFSYFMELDNH